jgi:hypothetical protein
MNSRILKLEIWGMVFVSLLGSFLHFTFALSGKSWFIATFSAVNESTWEHLKLAVMPAILWLLLEFFVFKIRSANFWPAKVAALWLAPILIIVFFYSYTAILGYNLLIFDISTFILAVIISQIVSYKLITGKADLAKFSKISAISVVILLLAFITFTFFPPHNFLFLDPVSGFYGILK